MSKVLQVISSFERDAWKIGFVDFCIRSDSLDPQAITAQLGITPTRAWAKGDKHMSKVFDTKTRKIIRVEESRSWGIWGLDSRRFTSAKEVEKHVLCLLKRLERKKSALRRLLRDRKRYTIRFFIWWEPRESVGCFPLSSDILRRMANLCHYTDFDFIGTD